MSEKLIWCILGNNIQQDFSKQIMLKYGRLWNDECIFADPKVLTSTKFELLGQ